MLFIQLRVQHSDQPPPPRTVSTVNISVELALSLASLWSSHTYLCSTRGMVQIHTLSIVSAHYRRTIHNEVIGSRLYISLRLLLYGCSSPKACSARCSHHSPKKCELLTSSCQHESTMRSVALLIYHYSERKTCGFCASQRNES